MSTSIVPLTPDLWPAFEDLFGKQGACFGCWCTYFRMAPKERQANSGDQKKQFMRQRIENGPPPGLLVLDGAQAIGWMQIGPRSDVPQWNNARRGSAPLDPAEATNPDVWAISCFFVRSKARGRGLTHRLVAAGIEHARNNDARTLDACPMVSSKDKTSLGLFVGSKRVFDKAGFSIVAEKIPNRPLMRIELR
ncbi:MAG: GNAT family N-acetyltransferase [Rhizobiaceae bacterium]